MTRLGTAAQRRGESKSNQVKINPVRQFLVPLLSVSACSIYVYSGSFDYLIEYCKCACVCVCSCANDEDDDGDKDGSGLGLGA